jgi:hypothetical protein
MLFSYCHGAKIIALVSENWRKLNHVVHFYQNADSVNCEKLIRQIIQISNTVH